MGNERAHPGSTPPRKIQHRLPYEAEAPTKCKLIHRARPASFVLRRISPSRVGLETGCREYLLWNERRSADRQIVRCGLSEAVAYGDDAHGATNDPIIRITNSATNHVFYCRTFGHSTRAIGPDVTGTTNFAIPAATERGLAKLELVANGIPSPAITVIIK